MRGDRGQDLSVEARCRLVELPAGGARLLEIAHRQHDLDVRGQEPRALQPIAGRPDHAADGARRRVPIPLSQAQERQARLRLHARPAGAAIGRLGRCEFAAQPMNLRLLIMRAAGRLALDVAHATLDRATRLLDGLRPGAAHLHDLRAVDEAVSGEHAELRMSLAPAAQRRGPLAHAVERIDAVAARDRAAVDDAGDDRRQLARGGGHHRLVQQGESALELTLG